MTSMVREIDESTHPRKYAAAQPSTIAISTDPRVTASPMNTEGRAPWTTFA